MSGTTDCDVYGPEHCGKYSWCEGCAMMGLVERIAELEAALEAIRYFLTEIKRERRETERWQREQGAGDA